MLKVSKIFISLYRLCLKSIIVFDDSSLREFRSQKMSTFTFTRDLIKRGYLRVVTVICTYWNIKIKREYIYNDIYDGKLKYLNMFMGTAEFVYHKIIC